MIKIFKRVIFLVSLLALYLIIKELITIIHYTKAVNIYLMYTTIAIFIFGFFYLIIVPALQILTLSKIYTITKDRNKIDYLLRRRIDNFRKNPHLLATEYDMSTLEYTEECYDRVTEVISKQCHLIRKKYVMQIFLTTGVSQNGFLDAFLILSGSFGMIKEIFFLYHGRVPDRELLKIFQKIYYSMAIGGSGLVEYAVEEFMSKLAGDFFKSIPFINKIFSSLADGYINAAVFTWVSLVTENYCRKIFVLSDKDLYPSSGFFLQTFNSIATETISILKKRVQKRTTDMDEDRHYSYKNTFLHKLLGVKSSKPKPSHL